jgi:hypothetical protein
MHRAAYRTAEQTRTQTMDAGWGTEARCVKNIILSSRAGAFAPAMVELKGICVIVTAVVNPGLILLYTSRF